ncbi:MAG: DrmB family protein [Candidatus Promineifilaceae bacterium]
MNTNYPPRVGEVRPSQLLYTYGVGAIVDLPKLSVIITGLEDWQVNPEYYETIVEDRLLTAVRFDLPEVKKLLAPPIVPDTGAPVDPFESAARVGVPVATFPRWMVCPSCRLLAPLSSGLFELKANPVFPDRTAYIHKTCNKAKKPQVVPARFLAACEQGHLDDFPWYEFLHRGNDCEGYLLRLIEYGASGEARDLEVRCDTCGERRRLSEAFGEENRRHMPRCRGRRPHLRDFDPDGCTNQMRTLILGASNTWFPVVYSTVAIPSAGARLSVLINEQWATFSNVTSPTILEFLRRQGQLGELSEFSDKEIWEAIEARRRQDAGELPPPSELPDLIEPEWEVFTQYDPALNSDEFRLTPVVPPQRYANYFDQVVLVERMREVRALIGFTRLDAVGELTDPDLAIAIEPAPISRQPPTWVPANEVRGEGIFLQFSEKRIEKWLRKEAVADRGAEFADSHVRWRQTRHIEPAEEGFPGMRYILIHTFAHAFMRQLALESGYSAASIRERIYARPGKRHSDPMAGLLIYTSAPDSEGTLGGLVSLGRPENLERHIAAALEAARLCASDPLCAEHLPSQTGRTLHAAACHACLFASETSCERGNKYLDRSLLVPTVERDDLAFFE